MESKNLPLPYREGPVCWMEQAGVLKEHSLTQLSDTNCPLTLSAASQVAEQQGEGWDEESALLLICDSMLTPGEKGLSS